MSVEYINRVVKRTAKLAGVTREVNTYLFRHTRLTEIRKKGVVGKMHNRFAGHADGSRQELVYDHMDNDDMKQEVLDKVYQVERQRPKPQPIQSQQTQIAVLEAQLRELLSQVKDSQLATTLGGQA